MTDLVDDAEYEGDLTDDAAIPDDLPEPFAGTVPADQGDAGATR